MVYNKWQQVGKKHMNLIVGSKNYNDKKYLLIAFMVEGKRLTQR